VGVDVGGFWESATATVSARLVKIEHPVNINTAQIVSNFPNFLLFHKTKAKVKRQMVRIVIVSIIV
jgi:hypothetical protein